MRYIIKNDGISKEIKKLNHDLENMSNDSELVNRINVLKDYELLVYSKGEYGSYKYGNVKRNRLIIS